VRKIFFFYPSSTLTLHSNKETTISPLLKHFDDKEDVGRRHFLIKKLQKLKEVE
jgi:hypothetical protein